MRRGTSMCVSTLASISSICEQTNLELSKCEAVRYVLVSLIVNTIAQRLGDSISVCEGL